MCGKANRDFAEGWKNRARLSTWFLKVVFRYAAIRIVLARAHLSDLN
jgi:hypothetical protein